MPQLSIAPILDMVCLPTSSTPGFKFAEWEMKGVPLRLELGPKDLAKSVVSYSRRDTGAKGTIALGEVASQVPVLLQQIQQDMYDKAEATFAAHRLVLTDWTKVVPSLNAKNLVIIPFCEEPSCEDQIKEKTKSEGEQRELGPDGKPLPTMGMKSLCIPFEQVCPALHSGTFADANGFCSLRVSSRERQSVSTLSADGTQNHGLCLVAAIRRWFSLLAQHASQPASILTRFAWYRVQCTLPRIKIW